MQPGRNAHGTSIIAVADRKIRVTFDAAEELLQYMLRWRFRSEKFDVFWLFINLPVSNGRATPHHTSIWSWNICHVFLYVRVKQCIQTKHVCICPHTWVLVPLGRSITGSMSWKQQGQCPSNSMSISKQATQCYSDFKKYPYSPSQHWPVDARSPCDSTPSSAQ